MQMFEIRTRNYQAFYDCENTARRMELEEAARYIDKIASIAGVNITDWNINEIFQNPNSEKGFILSAKDSINRAFFQELEKRKLGGPIVTNLSDELRKNFLEDAKEIAARSVKKYRNRIEAINVSCVEALNEARRLQTESHALYDAIDKYQDPALIARQMEKILSDPFWKLNEQNYGSSCYHFFTQPIVLTYVNREQASDLTVPLGSFQVRLDFDPIKITVHGHQNNMRLNHQYAVSHRVFHPHVAGDTFAVCYGNMSHDYVAAVGRRDFVKMMEITKLCLTTYGHENPYRHLYEFADELKRRTENPNPAPTHPMEESEPEEEETEGDYFGTEDEEQEPPVAAGQATPSPAYYSMVVPEIRYAAERRFWEPILPTVQPPEGGR